MSARVSLQRRRQAARLVVPLVAVMAVVALATRLPDLSSAVRLAVTNVPLLRSAVPAIRDRSPSGPLVFPSSDVSGFEARAQAGIAAAAGYGAVAEQWLIHGLGDGKTAFLTQFELCRLYWAEGLRERAADACRETKASALYWLNEGFTANERGDLEEALAYYTMAAATDPAMADAWLHIGRILIAKGRYEEAVPAYERVLVLDPSPPPDVFGSLGLAYLRVGNLEMARDVLNRGLLIDPGWREYYLLMADTYRNENDWQTADSWYARALQRWPYDAQVWAARGEVALMAGRPNEAIDFYRAASANGPGGAGYWLGLAAAAAASGNVTLATEAYRSALVLRPDDVATWLQAGRFFADSGLKDEARAAFERALALQPDNDEAAIALSRLAEDPNSP